MIFDICLIGNKFLVVIHKEFFKWETLKFFEIGNRLTDEVYSYCGKFVISETEFGFDGCLKQTREDESYRYFSFDFPKRTEMKKSFAKKVVFSVNDDDHVLLQKFLVTIHLMHHYVLEDMHYNKFLFETSLWKDQSLSFVMFFQGGMCGHSIGGQMYEWATNKLASLDTNGLAKLQKYVHEEISRFCLYFTGEEISFEQISFSNEAWFIQCSLNGRWA